MSFLANVNVITSTCNS